MGLINNTSLRLELERLNNTLDKLIVQEEYLTIYESAEELAKRIFG